ncbi:universal stress [Chlorella sorokiniana]|uniref:Universal stress n=1 Tax=Chlorella sorokiniana TaxID=3076 RepID=A0A2P6TTR5_CHLSO|nr:universal stress [Chlorella sorokiniana]|eukprot:PRW57460.1 universal stress [Chlorella sorokiniana]
MAQSPQAEAGAARPPSPSGGPRGRCVALVCNSWGHASTFYTWNWAKQYLLRRGPDGRLDPSEQLFIVKVGKDDLKDDRWKVGGPLVPDLETALVKYPHKEVVLEGGIKHNIAVWLAQQHVDVLVIPDQWPQSMLQKGLQITSVSAWVKANVHCPFVIIRRGAVVNARMKIGSQSQRPSSPEPSLSRVSEFPAAMTGRRVCIAYSTFEEGRGLLRFVRDLVLTQQDTIYIAHVFSKDQNVVTKEVMKMARALTLMPQRADSGGSDEVTRDNSLDFGAAELGEFPNLQLGVALQGDAKNALQSFCESEDIELLVMGTRSGGKIRKKLSGGGVSSHLIDNAPCPCLIVPYRYIGVHVDEGRDTADEEVGEGSLSPYPSSLPGLGGSPPAGLSATEGSPAAGGAAPSTPSDLLAQLQRQLEEKDRLIAELRQQVHDLQLAAAQGRQVAAQDPAHSSLTL